MKVENTLSESRRWYLPFLLIAGVSALAHLWCLGSVYFLDDVLQIRDNGWLRGEGKSGLYLRWTYFCYGIQTKLWGTSPVGFHFVNWLLHTGVALALYVFGRDCLSWKNAERLSLAGALFFVAHPLGSEIPNYARTQDLAWVTLFSLLAAWLAVRVMQSFDWKLLGALVLCVAGATFSKGPGIGHAVMMIAFAMIGCCTKEQWKNFGKNWKVLLVAVLVLMGVLWASGMLTSIYDRGASRVGAERLGWHAVTLCRVFWRFVALFLLPKGLCSDHFIAETKSWEDPQAWPAVIGFGAWLLLATGLMIWSKSRFFGMCLWLFAGAIVLRFPFFINEFMPEYRIYPGLPWLCLGVMGVLGVGWSRLTKVTPVGLMGMLLAVLCLVSALRSFQWHSLDTLSAATLKEYPWQLRAIWVQQRRDVRLEKWDAVIRRNADVQDVLKAFDEENRKNVGTRKAEDGKLLPEKSMSVGHQIMSQIACLGYYAEALAATGKEDQALAIIRSMGSRLEHMGISREKEKAIWAVYDHALGLVHEKRGELDEALEALERTGGKNHRALDVQRVQAKIAARDS